MGDTELVGMNSKAGSSAKMCMQQLQLTVQPAAVIATVCEQCMHANASIVLMSECDLHEECSRHQLQNMHTAQCIMLPVTFRSPSPGGVAGASAAAGGASGSVAGGAAGSGVAGCCSGAVTGGGGVTWASVAVTVGAGAAPAGSVVVVAAG
jgi:hypothetical protein